MREHFKKQMCVQVERTKNRPIVTGEVTEAQGWTLVGALTVLYVGILTRLPLLRCTFLLLTQECIEVENRSFDAFQAPKNTMNFKG